MKFNLKNRPRRVKDSDPIFWVDVEAWFVGFEKELREVAYKLGESHRSPYCREFIFKEILGE